uniref:Bromo domain-containing protein n=1 Tax=Setaria digitata TaxID=48799 RepID=A0A915PM02_9BILA
MSRFDTVTHNELLVAIQRYLSQGPCQGAAETLKDEIEKNQLLPVRYDYRGQAHQRSFEDFERSVVPSNISLVSLIERLSSLIAIAVPIPLQNLPLRIFMNKRHALDRKPGDLIRKPTLRIALGRSSVGVLKKLNPIRSWTARELGRPIAPKYLLHKTSMNNFELHYRILGHLSSVFCVAFDKSGSYVITGADDNLVKVWNVRMGLLRFTLRGHSAEISDMSISEDNTLLGTGSVDKTIRVWCLQTAAPLAFYRSHSAMVTLIAFLPFVDGPTRYLVSAGGDCLVNFYRYTSLDHQFEAVPTRFYERTSSGARIVSSCHSPGGSLVVFGDTHHNLRIYKITRDSIIKISDIEAHTDRVDSLAWAHIGLRFASGSRDGVAKIWKFEFNDWIPLVLHPKLKDEKVSNSRNTYKVTMLCWSLRDDFIITAGSDFILRVWSSISGSELRQMIGHKEDAYVLHSHPIFEDYVLSGGHDGFLMVWNVYTGILVKRHQNLIEGSGYGAVFDFAISPDGTLAGAVDSHGHLSILGVGTNQMAKTTPKEQFFHTDYMPLILDENNYFVDEETEIAPHLMGPPRMVDADGVDYDDDVQAMVPGRDLLLRDDSLIPQNPPWLSRPMVCTLPKSTVEIKNVYLTELRQQEEDVFIREMNRTRPRVISVIERKNNVINTGSQRRRAGVRWSECFPQRQRRLRNQQLMDETEIDDDVTEASTADSSFISTSATDDEVSSEDTASSDDSSDSDYVINTRRSSNQRRRRIEMEVDDSTFTSDTASPVRTSRRRRRRIVMSDETEDAQSADQKCESTTSASQLNYMDSEPGPSNVRSSLSAIAALHSSVDSTSGISTPHSPSEQDVSPTPLDNYDADADFPRWMRLTQPLRFPYIAQIGDEVVYFRQGHEFYLHAVETKGLYHVTHRLKPLAQLNAEEFCIVDEIRYLRKPYRLTAVKLAQTNAGGMRTGLVFSVKFHDMENVPDFIILRHLYDESVARRYQPGTRIEIILDNHWWTGTIDKKEVHDEENYPRSNWYCLTVRWDTGEDEKMSPWDVQPQQPNRRSGIASEEDQVLFSQYPVNERDWIGAVEGITACSGRLIDAIRSMEDDPHIKPFAAPVNLIEYPDYLWDVDYPIDLSTIVERVRNRFYRRLASLEQDIRYIAINARLFNQPNSEIVRNSRVLVETLIRYLNDAQYTDAMQLFRMLKAGQDSELREYNNLKQCTKVTAEEMKEEPSTVIKKGKHRSRSSGMSPNPSVDLPPEWYIECVNVLDEVMSERTSTHFISSGNEWLADVFSSYDDLSTVKEKVISRVYNSPLEVVNAVKTLMQACRNAVDNKRSPVFRDSLTCAASFDSKMAPVVAKWQRMRQSENTSSSTNEHEGHHLRDRPKNLHVYNTRSFDFYLHSVKNSSNLSRHEEKQHEDQKNGVSTNEVIKPGRSGRSGRMPSGSTSELFASTSNNQDSGRSRRSITEYNHARNRDSYENNNVQTDQPGPSGLQNKSNLINLRRSSRKREKRYDLKGYFSGTVTVTDDSAEDTAKDDDTLCDGSTAEIDDDALSDCSWNIRTSGTKKNKSHRKRLCGSQENAEVNKKRRRQTVLKKFGSEANSVPNSMNGQDSRMTRAYVTRNRQGHVNHTATRTNCSSHPRVRLRRSVQRNVNYNEGEVSDGDNDDDEASNSSARRTKKGRKQDR